MILLSKIESYSNVIWDMFSVVNDVRDEVLFIDINLQDLASLAHTHNTLFIKWFSGYENEWICQLLAVKKNWILNLVDVEVAELGDNKDDSELFNSLHKDREITLNIRGHLNVNTSLELLLARGRVADFHKVNLLGWLSRFFLTEAEDVVFVSDSIRNWDISKTTSISL